MMALPTVGARRQRVVCEELTRTQIVQYAGASGDFSPLHTDDPAARAAGYPSIMGHGMLTMAASAKVLTDWYGSDALRTLSCRFIAPVWPGDQLTASATVEAVETVGGVTLVRVALSTVNRDGQVVLTGAASAVLEPGVRRG
jgi:acyl dehydratase